MIKNDRGRRSTAGGLAAGAATAVAVALAVAAVACDRDAGDDGRFQGVVEYEERDLAFEVAGRITGIAVAAGDPLAAGALVAQLDDRLARSALAAREGEAQAAGDQLALLRAGARAEDLRALRARLDAARASEGVLERNAARAHQLSQAQAMTPAAADEADAQLERARGERRALEENLRALGRGARSQEIGAAEHRLAAAQAAAELERERVARHRLRVGQDAEVLEVHLHASEMAAAGVPVVTVADVAHPYVEVFVPQARVSGIRAGLPAFARVDGVTREIAGQVELVRRRTEFTPHYLFSEDERSHLVVRVRVRFTDPDRRLSAGVPAFVRIEVPR
jgi:HlyD family secretion protein